MKRREALKALSKFSLGIGTLSIYSTYVFREYIPIPGLNLSTSYQEILPKYGSRYVASLFKNERTGVLHWAPFPIFLNGTKVALGNAVPFATSLAELSNFLLSDADSSQLGKLDGKKQGLIDGKKQGLILEYVAVALIELENGKLSGIGKALTVIQHGLAAPSKIYTRRQLELFVKLSILNSNNKGETFKSLTSTLGSWRNEYNPEYLKSNTVFDSYWEFMHQGEGFHRFSSSVTKRNKWLSSEHNLWA